MGDWVIAGQKGNTPPTAGKFYEVRHSRKGTFKVRVEEASGEWAVCTIVEGTANAIMSYNVKDEGERLSIRDTLSYWIPLDDAATHSVAEHVPMAEWGKDHWSTFAYAETRVVDHGGKLEKSRMRCNSNVHPGFAAKDRTSIDGAQYPTKLKTTFRDNHDDWSCIEDAEAEGLLVFKRASMTVKLTDKGRRVAALLRNWKANKGQFANFEYRHG